MDGKSSEKMREGFEAAYQAEVERSGMTFEPAVFAKNEGGEYVNGLVQSAWWAWQASRSAIVIEHRNPFAYDGGDILDQLDAQGVRVNE